MSDKGVTDWETEIPTMYYLPDKPKGNPIMKTMGVLLTLCGLVIAGSFAILIANVVYEVNTYEPRYEKELNRDATMTIEYLWFIADDGDDGDDISFYVGVDYDGDDTDDFTCEPSVRWESEKSNVRQTMNNACETDIWISKSTSSASAAVDGLDISVSAEDEGFWSDTCYDLWREEGGCGVWWQDRTYQAPVPYNTCEYDGQILRGNDVDTYTANGLDDGDDSEYNMHISFKVMIDYTYTCTQVA